MPMRADRAARMAGAAVGAAKAADPRFTWAQRLTAIPAMLMATALGRTGGAPKGAVAAALAGIVYVLSPLDLLPEIALGPIGLIDDAGIAALSIGYLIRCADRYLRLTVPPRGPMYAAPAPDDPTVTRITNL